VHAINGRTIFQTIVKPQSLGKEMSFWENKTVLVTGGSGFLGRQVLAKLRVYGCSKIIFPGKSEYDLRERDHIVRLLETSRPDLIIHLAAVVGGIGANRSHPGQFFYDNAIMGTQLIEYARRLNVPKFVCLGTVCAYPKFAPVPFREKDLWNGYPEETNAPYGLAKKILLVQAQAYRQEYGFNCIYLLPVNLYGPGDNFDLQTSHVVPALIRKFLEARARGEHSVKCWGTGAASREFLYVEDAAEAILLAAEYYNKPDPVNIGSGNEVTIRNLAVLLSELTCFQGHLIWESSQPDGQPRRCLDITRAEREFGFKAKTSLRDGLQRTIDWYLRTSQCAVER
jgi:GDP-L-fucose synthase